MTEPESKKPFSWVSGVEAQMRAELRGAALPAEHAPPDTPWYWSRSADGGTMAYFKRVTDNWNFAGHLTDTEANAVRDALNAAANGAPLTGQISKLVDDINKVFAPRIRELLAENDVLRGSRPALAGRGDEKAGHYEEHEFPCGCRVWREEDGSLAYHMCQAHIKQSQEYCHRCGKPHPAGTPADSEGM